MKTPFNNKLQSYEERLESVQEWMNTYENEGLGLHEDVAAKVSEALAKDESLESQPISKHLENVASYLLKAKDLKSPRRIEDSFYENESDYRRNYKVGNNSIANDTFTETIGIEIIDEGINEEYLDRMFDVKNLNIHDLRRLIVKGCSSIQISKGSLRNRLVLFESVVKDVATEAERQTIDGLRNGRNLSEIAKQRGVSKAAVNYQMDNLAKRLKKMCKMT